MQYPCKLVTFTQSGYVLWAVADFDVLSYEICFQEIFTIPTYMYIVWIEGVSLE